MIIIIYRKRSFISSDFTCMTGISDNVANSGIGLASVQLTSVESDGQLVNKQ